MPVPIRRADVADAAAVGALLERFNREFDTPTPGPDVLAARLQQLLADGGMFALVAGEPAIGVALVSLRPNVWSDGPVALLDELYVVPDRRNRGVGSALLHAIEGECRVQGSVLLEINVDGEDADARRFYERHGYTDREPGQTDAEIYYHRELA